MKPLGGYIGSMAKSATRNPPEIGDAAIPEGDTDANPAVARNERRAGRPTSEETEQLNEAILNAAFDVFVREGFGGASIEKIAQRSRTTRRSILNRFPDKGALLLATVEMAVWRFQRSIEPADAMLMAKPLEALKAMCQLMLDNVTNQDGIDLYCLSLAHVGRFPAMSTVLLHWNDSLELQLKMLVERTQRLGFFSNRDPAMVATALVGAFISNPVNRTALGDRQFRDPTSRQRYFNGLWEMILTGPQAATPSVS